MYLEQVEKLNSLLVNIAPYMERNIFRLKEQFGMVWEEGLNETLNKILGNDDEKFESIVKGYVRFALESAKLQKKFEKDHRYVSKTYKDAIQTVYHNGKYMYDVYLPGMLLSHYLWSHHYSTLQYFYKSFVPYLIDAKSQDFCEIGLGTGFYSRQMLLVSDKVNGTGIDISDFSLNFTTMHLEAFGIRDRWRGYNQNVINVPLENKWPFILSVEVLEHLEDPLRMLIAINNSLTDDGKGFIVVAITAPNEDHIYLYNNCQEVIDQIQEAGMQVIEYDCFNAYEYRGSDLIPKLGVFIVSK